MNANNNVNRVGDSVNQEIMTLVNEAMRAGIGKEDFKRFIEIKKLEINRNT
ncbi:hypothetical protein [Metabacillus bambusae]|uniref:Sin domain-containing protein n=1 Tax=Metabacillus bambusae TaxID=2795218 RepID=A0ABS3N2I9_9BACI|nr:hypothetical protein [Metabacillus bambusae]MBO1512138.1 hypothetical protein [Metabacillus bambusae]